MQGKDAELYASLGQWWSVSGLSRAKHRRIDGRAKCEKTNLEQRPASEAAHEEANKFDLDLLFLSIHSDI